MPRPPSADVTLLVVARHGPAQLPPFALPTKSVHDALMDVERIDLFAGQTGELTLWELADTKRMVQAATELYGLNAATAAAHCALHAHFDGRESDYRFWCKVFHELKP